MFNDLKARRKWRLYRLRAELMLGAVARDIRRQLLEDLEAHVRDAVANGDSGLPEHERVAAALAHLGDPKDFIAPLIADAVLNAPARGMAPGVSLRAIAHYAGRGGAHIRRTASILALGAGGAAMAVLAAASFIRPGRAGVFLVSEDAVEIRLFGLSGGGGTPLFAPWLEVAIGAVGVALLIFAWRLTRRTIAEIVAGRA